MIATEDRLAHALETAVEDLEFTLDSASLEFEVMASPHVNQYIIFYAEGERRAYVTADLTWDDKPIIFVDIYSVDDDGGERWVCGDLSIDAAALYIING